MLPSTIFFTIAANLATTGCALLLVRRGPTPRLRLLTLAVGLMSFSQTTSVLHAQGIFPVTASSTPQFHYQLLAALALLSLYLLCAEIYDRNLIDRRLRLAEFGALPVFVEALPLAVEEPETWELDRILATRAFETERTGPLAGAVLDIREPVSRPAIAASIREVDLFVSRVHMDVNYLLNTVTARELRLVPVVPEAVLPQAENGTERYLDIAV